MASESSAHRGSVGTEGLSRAGTFTRSRRGTARDYAERVRDYSANVSPKSLNPGENFRVLADFLWQPFVSRPPQLKPKQKSSPATERHEGFASLYKIANGSISQVSFTTVEEFDELGDDVVPTRDCFALLLLQGYPSPEWLNALGARFAIDPEFLHRHLLFASTIGRTSSKHSATQILPSCRGRMLSLQTTTIGLRECGGRHNSDQEALDSLRQDAREKMGSYIAKLGGLNSPAMAPGDPIVREFSLHDFEHFSLEQTMSLAIHRTGEGWIGIVWHDGCGQLDRGLQGPWQASTMRTNSFEVKYLPIAFHKPDVVLKSKRRKASGAHLHAQKSTTAMESILEDYGSSMDLRQASHDPLYALGPFFQLAVSSEMALLDVINAKVRDELDHARLTSHESPTLSNLLYNQQVLRRHIRDLKNSIQFLERFPKRPGVEEQSQAEDRQGPSGPTEEVLLDDYRAALRYAEDLAVDCDKGMSIVAHNATIREAEKATEEARGVVKLTRLAVLFVPLSFITSVFGMNVRELDSDGGPPIWIWALASAVAGFGTWVFFKYSVSRVLRETWRWLARLRAWRAEHASPDKDANV